MEHDLVKLNGYYVDRKFIFSLKSPFKDLDGNVNLYKYKIYRGRYLFSNNGILYDMLYNHQEKLYISKDKVPIYYYINEKGDKEIRSVMDIKEELFPNSSMVFFDDYMYDREQLPF